MICESSDRVPRDAAVVRWLGPIRLAGADHSAVRDLEIEHEVATAWGTVHVAQVARAGGASEKCYKTRLDPTPYAFFGRG